MTSTSYREAVETGLKVMTSTDYDRMEWLRVILATKPGQPAPVFTCDICGAISGEDNNIFKLLGRKGIERCQCHQCLCEGRVFP